MADKKKVYEVTVAELLEEDVDRELVQREGEWSAFSAAVFRRLDEAETSRSRMSIEDQSIAQLKTNVDRELQELAPRFEEAFRDGVEQRIWQSARETPSVFGRIKGSLARFFQPTYGWGLGWAAAGVAVALLILFPLNPAPPDVVKPSELVGHVAVESVSFEGTVTVSPEEGVTVIWLSETS